MGIISVQDQIQHIFIDQLCFDTVFCYYIGGVFQIPDAHQGIMGGGAMTIFTFEAVISNIDHICWSIIVHQARYVGLYRCGCFIEHFSILLQCLSI